MLQANIAHSKILPCLQPIPQDNPLKKKYRGYEQ